MTFDATEYERWIRTAREDLAVARHATHGSFHHAAVLYAEQGAQCALKALLHAVGRGDLGRGHGLVDPARTCEELAGLQLDDGARDRLAELSRSYQATRYPDALPSGTPSDHFTESSARDAIAAAEDLCQRVERLWIELQKADGGEQ